MVNRSNILAICRGCRLLHDDLESTGTIAIHDVGYIDPILWRDPKLHIGGEATSTGLVLDLLVDGSDILQNGLVLVLRRLIVALLRVYVEIVAILTKLLLICCDWLRLGLVPLLS